MLTNLESWSPSCDRTGARPGTVGFVQKQPARPCLDIDSVRWGKIRSGVVGISDLDLRVALYPRHEARLEMIRRQRHSAQAREIAAEAVRKAETDKAAGFDWDDSFAQLRHALQDITARL